MAFILDGGIEVGSPRKTNGHVSTDDAKSLPPRSPSGKKLRNWLSKHNPTSQENLHSRDKSPGKSGRFGTWMHSRFGRSPSGRTTDPRVPVPQPVRYEQLNAVQLLVNIFFLFIEFILISLFPL